MEKVAFAGLTTIGSLTVRLTGILWGLFDAPGALIVIVAGYVPETRPEFAKETVIALCPPVDVPLDGEHDSHAASS
jgi:hypothetical protein